MVDEPKTDATETSEQAPPAVDAEKEEVQSQVEGDSSTQAKDQVAGLVAQQKRYKAKVEKLEKQNVELKKQAMTSEEKAIDAAKAEGAAPYKQRLQDIEGTLQGRLDQKLDAMTDDQKDLVPDGLSVAERLIQADKVLGMQVDSEPASRSVGGASNPKTQKARIFTHSEYQDIAQRAASHDRQVREAAKEEWKEAKQAHKGGRVGRKIS